MKKSIFFIVTVLSVSLAASVFAQGPRVRDNAPPPPPGGSGKYFRVDYPGSTEPNQLRTPVTYVLWIPDGAKQLRGVIIHQHGAGSVTAIQGSTAAYDLHWQALAKKWDCALWCSSYHMENDAVDLTPGGAELWFDPRRGSEKTFLKGLDEFAAKSGHPELAKVPWILWGHSGGGIWADVMTTLHPERVVAVWMRSGSAEMFRQRSEFPQPQVPEGAYKVPAMGNPGAKESGPYTGTLATFKQYRLKGAPVGFAPDPRTGHECGDSRYLAIPYLDACMAMRLPDKGSTDQTLKPVDTSHGWLAALVEKDPQNAAAVPAAEYRGNPLEAVWLPNEAVAKAWVEYVKTGAVSDTTPPPAPFDVKVSKGETGVEITWNAAADFESGIRNFIVLRDGQELASVPEEPVGRFGRPLFQSMTFHDTPDQPLPAMRYLDTLASAGEKHAYTVVEVNSVSLKSQPSVAAFADTDVPQSGANPILANYGPARYFYVSPNGKDSNIGTIEKPLATFEAAQEKVRTLRKNNSNTPITVYFRGGKYYLAKPVVFSAIDGGSESSPVIYKAYPGEAPYVLGGEKLSLNWTKYKGGIYKAQVPKGVVFESLYVNDQMQVLARYPNYDAKIRIFNGYAADAIAPERVKQWKSPAGGYFHAIHGHEWGSFHFQITGKKSETELELTGGWQNNRPEGGLHSDFRFVENIFEELDAENEWYLDKQTATLYFYPDPSVNMATANFEYAALENLVSFSGTPQKPVKNITLDGFKFMRTVRTFLKNREPLLRSDWTIYRGGSVYLEGTQNCEVKNCEFSQIGGNAIFFNHYNKNALVKGCHIYEIGANAICFVGDTSAVRNPKYIPYGPRVTEKEMDLTPGPKNNNYPQHCVVDDNLIHDIGRVEKQVAGVEISMAAYITLSRNSIYNTPRAGINIGEGAWGGHLLEFNDVFNTVLETGDHGSFNSWGRDRFWGYPKEGTDERVGKDPSIILLDMLAPNVIRNNRFKCDHGWDIDLDDGSSYYEIYNNLCLNGGIKLREGYYRTAQNNICVNNGMHLHVWQKNSGDVVRGNILSTVHQPVYMDYWGKEVDYNWFVYPDDLKKVKELGTDKHSEAGDPLFVDPKNGDFSVSIKSKAYELGWKNFAMDQFGVQKASLKAIAKTPVIPELKHTEIAIENMVLLYSGQVKNLTTDGEVSATGMAKKTGVIVLSPPVQGPFTRIKLARNDVILKINDVPVPNVTELQNAINKGEIKTVTVWRNQKELVL